MQRRNLGLTKLYNLVNDQNVAGDADVSLMRHIHRDLDVAVMEAYGWGDVDLDHGFYMNKKVERWTVCPAARQEILDRLLEENHRRAAVEKENGTSGSSKRTSGSKQAPQLVTAQEKMF
jgi:hypothetical protein